MEMQRKPHTKLAKLNNGDIKKTTKHKAQSTQSSRREQYTCKE